MPDQRQATVVFDVDQDVWDALDDLSKRFGSWANMGRAAIAKLATAEDHPQAWLILRGLQQKTRGKKRPTG